MFLHVEHAQQMQKGQAWCGVSVVGPRIVGLDNMLYHAAQPTTAPVCPGCLEAILNRFAEAVRKTQGGA